MLSKEELQKIAENVASDAEKQSDLSTEELIARVKAHILKEAGNMIAMNALTMIAGATNMEKTALDSKKMLHAAFLIAGAAAMIMRRTWIG